MDIEYSMLTGKIYARTKKEKVDITKEVVFAVQVLLHNKALIPDDLFSKLENKTYRLVIEETKECK